MDVDALERLCRYSDNKSSIERALEDSWCSNYRRLTLWNSSVSNWVTPIVTMDTLSQLKARMMLKGTWHE